MNKKILTSLALIICVLALTIGTTLAWLTAQTPSIENTFTVGNINIKLEETTGDQYKLVPGAETEKDPKVRVLPQSEACYLYIKIEEDNNLADYVEYSLDGWTVLYEGSNVYYREVSDAEAAAGVVYSVLAGDKVTAKRSITKEMVDGLTEDKYPTMTFTAYAIQKVGFTDAMDAWSQIFGSSN